MARFKPVERGQGYFLTIYPEAIFEEHSIERVIDRFIEDFADIRMFESKYKNDITGQRAISPLVMLKVIIYGLSQGIDSMRKIEKMLQLNHPGFLFLSGNRTIDHSTLCYFLNSFQDEIAIIFGRLLCLMEELELIDWRKIMIDGTRVSSNASKEYTRDSKGFKKKLKQYENLSKKLLERARYIADLKETGKIDDDEEKEEKDKIEKQQKKYKQIIDKLKLYEEEVAAEKISPDEKVNLTDGESTLLKKDETFIQGYNVQAAFSNNDILLAIEATNNANDGTHLSHMIEKVELLKQSNNIEEETDYLLDAGYFNISDMTVLIKEGKKLYIPPTSHFTQHWFITEEHDFKCEDDGVYFICKGRRKKKGKFKKKDNSYEFSLSRSFCNECEHYSSCWEGKEENKKRYFGISKTYTDNKQLWKDYNIQTQSIEWIQTYNKRIGKEHNFFDLKNNNGLNRLHWRGKRKCSTISYVGGIAYNLKKFQKAIADIGWKEVQLALG